MSLFEQAQHHELMESLYAKAAVRFIQEGKPDTARCDMELAARERHLAYEAFDTERVASAAFMEWSGEQLAKRRTAAVTGTTQF